MRGRISAILVLLLVLGGCAGRDFVRPPADAFRVGTTTETQIRERFETPYQEGTAQKNGETMKTLGYTYASGAASLAGGVTPARAQGFYLWNGVLVGHEFTSSFDEDKTDFDAPEARSIRKGDATEPGHSWDLRTAPTHIRWYRTRPTGPWSTCMRKPEARPSTSSSTSSCSS
jgi:hypothetical protein